MTLLAESPSQAEPEVYFRPVVFLPSGRDDCVAVARMTFEEWLHLDYEGGLSEWVEGEARLYMSATNRHQAIVEFLIQLMGPYVRKARLGVVKLAPYAMEAVRGGSGREPDLTFVATGHEDRRRESHLVGPPDLVVEVVSEDSVARDLVEKLREYEAAGVREYWVIDSRPNEARADFFVLVNGRFLSQPADAEGVYRSPVIPGFWLKVDWLLAKPLPTAWSCAHEVLEGGAK